MKEELIEDEEDYIDVKEEIYRDVSPHQPEHQITGKYEEEYIDVKEEIYRDVSPHQPEPQIKGECEENLTLSVFRDYNIHLIPCYIYSITFY